MTPNDWRYLLYLANLDASDPFVWFHLAYARQFFYGNPPGWELIEPMPMVRTASTYWTGPHPEFSYKNKDFP